MTNLPPHGPPSGPPSGPFGGPPSGPPSGPFGGPPSGPAYSGPGGPEVLDSGAGGRIPPPYEAPGEGGGRRRRRGLLVGGGVVGLVAVAGGAFAVYQVAFATGPQPAEALPASTIGYVSVDLDPSGQQKLEALETLEKFPAFQDNVDVDSDDDLRETLFEVVQDDGICAEVSWADDIEPWLGDRFGVAAVDLGEELAPDTAGIAPLGVVQVEDADAADAGLRKLQACAAGSAEADAASDRGGWSIEGGWLVLAQSTDIAEAVSRAAQEDPLSEDEDFQKWTGAAGDPGILTAYVAPEAASLLADTIGSLSGGAGISCTGPFPGEAFLSEDIPDDFTDPPFPAEGFPGGSEDCTGDEGSETGENPAQALRDSLSDFAGAAVTVRFDDGGVEIESASSSDFFGLDTLYSSARGGDAVAGLPEDTAVAFGLGLEEGWFTALTDYAGSFGGGLIDVEEGLAQIEEATGLQLPEDAETLLGESVAVAVGGDLDPEGFEAGPGEQPIGVKVTGDPDAITAIVDRLLEDAEVADDVKDEFNYQTDDEHVVAGFSESWNDAMLEDGGLGDSDTYQDVVRESGDAAAVLYVDFDAGGWLERAVEAGGGDGEVLANVEPLRAFGTSLWTEDDVAHGVLRLTTE